MKKYREPIKRSIRTLYKRSAKDSGGNEWVCTHCGLTFDNPSLLNLHTLTHAAEDVGLGERQLNTLEGVEAEASYNPETDINDGQSMLREYLSREWFSTFSLPQS